ncbi:retrovirus-related pol polyprotein from transposon TNT 1-94 [Tanacetum coccineum]
MTQRYKISIIGILNYFLRFQIELSERGISINKERYVKDLLRKYEKISSLVNTQIVPPNMLGPDIKGKDVNESQYRGMIGALMNLTASRTDIQFSTGIYARHQANISNPTLLLLRELSAEAKDIAAAGCCANILWIKSQLIDYDIIYEKIKNHTLKRDIEFHFIPTQYQLAAIFIKLLDKPSFKRLIDEIVKGASNIEVLRGRKPTLDYFKVFGSKCFILNTKHYLIKFDPKSYEGVFLGYSQNSKAYIILNKHTGKIEESLNMTFDETPPPSKTSHLVDDDLDEEETIKVTENKTLENDIEDETLEIDEIVNIKESRNYPLENVIRILNQRTLRNKLDENGIGSQNKARLVAQSYNQQEGIDYDETYASVARLESIRILLAYACALDFKVFQMDVKSTFLNGFINEEVYVVQPPGFIDFEKPDHVYKLKKALYGLKQAPKAWYDRLKAFLIKHEYKMGMLDNTHFTMKKSSNIIIVQIFVNDIIFGSTCQDMCDEFAKIMHDEFEMSMMEMLKKFGLKDSKPMKTPMSSDTKLTKDEERESIDSTKHRSMIGIMHLGLWYPKGTGIETVVYADSDHAKQTALAISTTETEYGNRLDNQLDDFPIMCDNKGAIDLSKNPVQHSRTKHIEIRHHFLRDNVQKGHISIKKVPSVDNIIDILTKPLKRESFNYIYLGLGMMEHIP